MLTRCTSGDCMSIPGKYVVLCKVWVLSTLAAVALAGPKGAVALAASLGALVTLLAALVTAWALWDAFRRGWMPKPRRVRPGGQRRVAHPVQPSPYSDS